MRAYLPSTLPRLRTAVEAGEVGPPPLIGTAVTPALREWYPARDLEELGYVALTAAARASLGLLAADPAAPRRRVVVVADIADPAVLPTPGEPGAVTIAAAVPLATVAAVHVDDVAARAVVAAAVGAFEAAAGGDPDAQFVVDEAQAHELLWYAGAEIGDLPE